MKTALLFSGQGAQHPGMMQELIAEYPCAQELFDLAKEVNQRELYQFIADASSEELNKTQNTQPCITACQLAALRIVRQLSIPFEAVLGFSLGEWAALVAAEVADECCVMETVLKRADAMQKAVPIGTGAMATLLGMSEADVIAVCNEIGNIAPANYNCSGNITVAGTNEAIERLLIWARENDTMATKLSVSIPSHCSMMEPAVQELSPVIQNLSFHPPQKELFMNATGEATTDVAKIKQNLMDQLAKPVLFMQSVEQLLDMGYDTFIEIGPGKVLCGMVKRIAKKKKVKVQVLPLNSLDTLEVVISAMTV